MENKSIYEIYGYDLSDLELETDAPARKELVVFIRRLMGGAFSTLQVCERRFFDRKHGNRYITSTAIGRDTIQ